MYKFYLNNQKIIHKLIINQIAMSALGLMVGFPVNALAFNKGLGNIPNLVAGIFCACMYFFVIYDACWEWGSKFLSKKGDNLPSCKTAALSSLFALIPTCIVTAGYALCLVLKLGALNVFKWILLLVCNGMHFSTLNFVLAYVPQSYSDIVQLAAFVVFIGLTILVCTLGFSVGIKGKTMFAGYFHKKPDTRK